MIKSPCYKCEKRYPGCHAKCESYLTFRERKDKENLKMREDRGFSNPDMYGGYAIYGPSWSKKEK